jgi:hypothetical protein
MNLAVVTKKAKEKSKLQLARPDALIVVPREMFREIYRHSKAIGGLPGRLQIKSTSGLLIAAKFLKIVFYPKSV